MCIMKTSFILITPLSRDGSLILTLGELKAANRYPFTARWIDIKGIKSFQAYIVRTEDGLQQPHKL